jgi:hypothetical protein
VIHDRVGLVEALGRDHMFIIDTFVLVTGACAVPMEPDVVLPGKFAETLIMRHG